MAHEIDSYSGVPAFVSNSAHEVAWHKLGERRAWSDVEQAIADAVNVNAIPTAIRKERTRTESGLPTAASAIVASYANRPDRSVGIVKDRYTGLPPAEFANLMRAAAAGGAVPSAIMSLREGSKTVASFALPSNRSDLVSYFVLADSFDGSGKLIAGCSTVRVVCQNTLSAALRADSDRLTHLRHTASLESRLPELKEAIEKAIKTGADVARVYDAAARVVLPPAAAARAFDALFPPAPDNASPNARTRAENARSEARRAAARAENRVGDRPGNLATLYNAATWLVDREVDGSLRGSRGDSDVLAAQFFGSRAERQREIETTIRRTLVPIVRPDGTTEEIELAEAIGLGIDLGQMGALDMIASGPDPRAVPAAPVASFTLDDLLA